VKRIVFVSLAAGSSVFLLLSGASWIFGWPVPWFGAAAGILVSLGLSVGLLSSRRRPAGSNGTARALFFAIGLLLGVLGLWALLHAEPGRVAYVPWLALVSAAVYLSAAAYLRAR
jgi:hypothetical protein